MNEENTKKLFDRFEFFRPGRPITENLMGGFGFECCDGWFDLLWGLCEGIEKELKKIPPSEETKSYLRDTRFKVQQVKEKFGGLRFFTNWETEEISDLINKAEVKSEVTCEQCGEPGKLIRDGWVHCFCEEHRRKE